MKIFGFSFRERQFIRILIIGGCLALSVGCSTLAKRNDSGVVVATRVPIRSSTAVVAADILFVSRGDQVDVLESVDVPDPN